MARFPGNDRTDDAPARFRKDPDPRFWRMNRSLPFFPRMSEAQVERVCAGLAAAVDASVRG